MSIEKEIIKGDSMKNKYQLLTNKWKNQADKSSNEQEQTWLYACAADLKSLINQSQSNQGKETMDDTKKEFTITVPYYLVPYVKHMLDFICDMNTGISNIHIEQVRREKVSAYYTHQKIILEGTNKNIMDKVYNTILTEDRITLMDKL